MTIGTSVPTGDSRATPLRAQRSQHRDEAHLDRQTWHACTQMALRSRNSGRTFRRDPGTFANGNPLDGTDYACGRFRKLPPQVAIDELWQTAGEGRIKATALECKNAKAFDGDLIEIPAHHWAHLKRVDDPLTGKAMLSDDNGRVYREVQFPRLDVKELWPKSPPLSGEPLEHVEKPEPEQTRPAEPELLEPKARPQPQKDAPPVGARQALYRKELPERHGRDHDRGDPREARPG